MSITDRAQFAEWLDYVPDYLEELPSLFPIGEQTRLDFSPASLDLIEGWILRAYSGTEAMLQKSESRTVNLLSCYIGETFRKVLGGKWDIRLDDPKFAFFGLPIITSPNGAECPLTLATAAADRRTGTYLRTVLENS